VNTAHGQNTPGELRLGLTLSGIIILKFISDKMSIETILKKKEKPTHTHTHTIFRICEKTHNIPLKF